MPATHVSVDVLALRADPASRSIQVALHRREWEPFAGELALPGVLLLAGETIADAASRALAKIGATPNAHGQLRTFDEPSRDPRGFTLSIATWAVIDDAPQARWVSLDEVPALAFDHADILATVRAQLASLLWRDLDFTRALTGPRFSGSTAAALTASLTRAPVHRANLNRELAKTPGLEAGEAKASGVGRPSTEWVWR